ncbi:hypothetical protein [Ligilactobacillus faecis]|uniref:Uncharacterized protein n=1 Tax=Ligilactobacillus faecis TaxID=762833 RepID=A0ABV4DSK5_9LACO|nr:hypothetical protein [Ligilactobacillus faecis]WGN88766.1 hypothetical protein QFX10_06760 [Ligilactobacillus faecis]
MEEAKLEELLNLTPAIILGKSVVDGAEKLVNAVEKNDQELVTRIIAKEKQLLDALEIIEQ